MGASAGLQPSVVSVTPGGSAVVEVRIRNTGSVVDQFDIDVVGEAAPWATVSPPSLSLFPGSDGTVVITFAPGQVAGMPSGSVPFGVRVRSKEDPSASVVEEGTLEVAEFLVLEATLRPRTARGRRGATYELSLDNKGTKPVQGVVTAEDPDQLLAFAATPATVDVPGGALGLVEIRVRALKPFRKGSPQSRQFQVVVHQGEVPDGPALAAVPAMFLQEATSPPWLRRAVLAALAVLVLLGLFWFGVLRPAVKSAARQAAKEAVAPPTIAPSKAGSSGAGSSGAGAGSSGSGAGAGATDSSSGAVTSAASTGASTTIDGRLFLTDKGDTSFVVPDGATLQLTDIVLQNPDGNTGPLQIRRNGTPLLVMDLANFRDLDYHFVAPIVFTAGQKLELSANCSSPTCTPGAYFAGYLVR